MNKIYSLHLFITLSAIAIINCANSTPISTSSATSSSNTSGTTYTSCSASKQLATASPVVSLCVTYTGTNYNTNSAVFSDCNIYGGLSGYGCTTTGVLNTCTIATTGNARIIYYYTNDPSTATHCASIAGTYQ